MKLWKTCGKFIFIFILLLNLECINCCTTCQIDDLNSCSGDQCNDCKPKYKEGDSSPNCYYCQGISSLSYYTIDSNGHCLINECLGDKIIDSTHECTFEIISTLYKLGDFYYYNTITSNSEVTCQDKICTCSSHFYTETKYGKKKINCLSLSSFPTNSYKYYNYKSKEFFQDAQMDSK